MNFKRLFTPIKINKMELRNRIVMPAMHLNYVSDGTVTERLVRFYEERAKGGVGLIIVGGCLIDEWSGGQTMIGLHKDEYIPGLKKLTAACHEHGAKIGAQLYMAGAYAHQIFIKRQALSSSAHQSRFTKEEAKEMTREEIAMVVNDFATAAARAKESGFDMVEILGSAGYLISQFLSPVINKREDEYGGELENRMRFGLEVVGAVREAVGPEFCVGIRLAGNDFVPGSHTNKESRIFARACEEARVDLINVTGGWHETRVPQITADLPRAGYAYLARGIKKAVTIPVAVSNRINQPALAEETLQENFGDLICMARPLIADPELPKKAAAGKVDDIRPCIACNQKCFDHVFMLKPIGCLVNALAGEEYKTSFKPVSTPKKVLVIGGGAAGCEAALRAAERGHSVTLYERESYLGGQILWWSGPVGKPEFLEMFRYYKSALESARVDMRLGVEFKTEMARKNEYDVAWIATGAEAMTPKFPGADGANVTQAWDVLKNGGVTGENIVIIGGGAVGLETAIYLAKKGTLTPQQLHFLMLHEAETPEVLKELMLQGSKRVTVVEQLPRVGSDIGPSTRWVVFKKLKMYDIDVHTKTKLLEITSDAAVCENEEGKELKIPADTVILAVGAVPVNSLAEELEEIMPGRTRLLGDAAEPRNAAKAVEAGFTAALALE